MTVEMQKLIADRDAIKNVLAEGRANGSLKAGTKEFADMLQKLEVANKAISDQEVYEALMKEDNAPKNEAASATVDGFKTIMNVVRGRKISNEAQVLIQGGDHGENYLIPEDVSLAIQEMKKEEKRATMLTTVMNTDGISGSFNFDNSVMSGLVSFADGDTLDDTKAPSFTRKTFTIGYKGAFLPVSDLLKGNEKANLMEYLRGWFVKRAVISENADIFAAYKANYNSGTPKALADWKGLSASINTDLDPAITESGDFVIVTNQSGFNVLDSALDEMGRPVLQPDPTNPTMKRFKGKTVIVFSDAQLPNISTTAPIFYGDTKRAIWFIQNPAYQFATDEGKGIGFTKGQTYLRVIEGYAVMAAHTEDYIYATLPLA